MRDTIAAFQLSLVSQRATLKSGNLRCVTMVQHAAGEPLGSLLVYTLPCPTV